MTQLRVALLASCTVEVLERPLGAALRERGFEPSFWISGFAQYQQDVLNPASGLYAHEPNVVLVYLDAEDLFRDLIKNPFAQLAEARKETAGRIASEVAALVDTVSQRLPGATIVLNTTAVSPLNALTGLEFNSEYGIQDAVGEYNRAIAAFARTRPEVVILDAASLAAAVGFSRWRDDRLWYLARLRLSRHALDALASGYASILAARLGKIKKCIALDLDNTLWGGIIGEDGYEGIKLGEDGIGLAFAEFQDELLNLYRKGVLLAVCSKNNSEDALQVIRNHPGMRLRDEHFAALRINWEDKASNLRALAEELNIGLDAFVFIDDNPVERSWVKQSHRKSWCPNGRPIRRLQDRAGPVGGSLVPEARNHRRRPKTRRGIPGAGGAAAARIIRDVDRGILSALEMRVRIGRADAFTIPRIAQLTQKTNQFNLTTRGIARPRSAPRPTTIRPRSFGSS
jgi:FkbH-like protein